MDIEKPWRRLAAGHFWREVDMEHNRIIANELIGCKDILDIGCGYGSLVSDLLNLGFWVMGIDLNRDNLTKGKELFSNVTYHKPIDFLPKFGFLKIDSYEKEYNKHMTKLRDILINNIFCKYMISM